MKTFRQSAILDLVAQQPIRSQDALRRRLADQGIEATQATISRDTKELGLVKRAADGAYQTSEALSAEAPGEGRIRKAVLDYLRRLERVDQFLVLKTNPGQAQPLAYDPAARAVRAPRARLSLADFEVVGELGEGSFSRVALARLRETGESIRPT